MRTHGKTHSITHGITHGIAWSDGKLEPGQGSPCSKTLYAALEPLDLRCSSRRGQKQRPLHKSGAILKHWKLKLTTAE